MNSPTESRSRNGNRWTINEILSLQREFELLELSIPEIADKHQRSVSAIENRLVDEDFTDWEHIMSLRSSSRSSRRRKL